MAIGANRIGKPPLRCSLLLHSSLTPLPGQWDRHQSCEYTLGATFVIIFQNFLIACHKSLGRATIACHNIKHVLWHGIATGVAFYSQSGLYINTAPKVRHANISQKPPYEKYLIKIKRIPKNYYNLRIIPAILKNGTFILLYSKVQKHPTQSDTP